MASQRGLFRQERTTVIRISEATMCKRKQAQAPCTGSAHKAARHQLVFVNNAQDMMYCGLSAGEEGDTRVGSSPIDPPGQLRVKDLDGNLQQPSCTPANKEL